MLEKLDGLAVKGSPCSEGTSGRWEDISRCPCSRNGGERTAAPVAQQPGLIFVTSETEIGLSSQTYTDRKGSSKAGRDDSYTPVSNKRTTVTIGCSTWRRIRVFALSSLCHQAASWPSTSDAQGPEITSPNVGRQCSRGEGK